MINLYVLLKNNLLMKEKVHEDSTMAATTPLMISQAKFNDSILWIRPWQNERQRSVNNFWSCIIGNLHDDWLRLFINAVFVGFIGKRASLTLPAPF